MVDGEPDAYSELLAHESERRAVLIKAADDKQPQVLALQALLERPDLDDKMRRSIDEEIWAIRAGAKTEADAAYEIEFQFGQSKGSMTIHDLRLEIGGRVAQFDHLIITRLMEIWVCESKSFTGGVAINDHGEWSTYRGRRPVGIASPIEQNKRHIQVLKDVFDQRLVALPKRLGMAVKPRFESLVLVSNSGIISRPKGSRAARLDGIERVIKCEQLVTTIDKTIGEKEASDVAIALLKVVGSETIERLARELAALHKPIEFDWHAKFGVSRAVPAVAGPPFHSSRTATISSRSSEGPSRGAPVAHVPCASCEAVVSEKVAAYARANSERFGGRILCYSCQRRH